MKYSILNIVLIPQIVDLIVKNEGLDDISTINEFYHSKTYDMPAKEETKMWHFSPLTIFSMWKHEKETGEAIYPEEQGRSLIRRNEL